MNSRKIVESQKIISAVITFVTIVLFLFGIMFLFEFIGDYRSDSKMSYSETTLEYQVDYPERLMEEARVDRMHDPDNRKMQEYYAMGEYLDAEVQISTFRALGNDELTAYWTEKRDEAKAGCGSLESKAEEFGAKLEK